MDPRIQAREYQICTRCIMDTTDPKIFFDNEGLCNHCQRFDEDLSKQWHPNDHGAEILKNTIEIIKLEQKEADYDCILGLSGGVDSSYLAYLAKQFDLRPLVFHVDTGWNSELATQNIESIVKALNYDLFTDVIDWEEMRDLQLAFFKAGLANQDVPQDHAIFASLYQFASKHKIKYVLNGDNLATECTLPESWGYTAMDSRHLKGVHSAFGTIPLKNYPVMNTFWYRLYFVHVKGMKIVKPFNLMPYSKDVAIKTMEEKLNWRYYGGKHYESRFTKFFQGYFLPTRFGYDKRRAHLSSLVCSGNLDRQTALTEIDKPLYSPNELEEDRRYIIKKLGIDEEIWEREIMNAPLRTYQDFPSYAVVRSVVRKAKAIVGMTR